MRYVLILLVLALVPLPRPVAAFELGDVIDAQIRPGWRLPDGSHLAALHLRLAPGWKTYWRAPGDAGIPPVFDWSGARNVGQVEVMWTAPHVFRQSGMRSVGYEGEVVLPLRLTVPGGGAAELAGEVELGLCKDVCIPYRVRVHADLPAKGKPDPAIAAALADQAVSGAEAGFGAVECRIAPDAGGLTLAARVDMPRIRGVEAVVETHDPRVWVAEPKTRWRDGALWLETHLVHDSGGAFALDRSRLRFTFLMPGRAVDIQGCTG